MNFWMIAVLAVASLAGSGLIFAALRAGGLQKQKLEALAAQEGWIYEQIPSTPSSPGAEGTQTLRDPGDDWVLSLSFTHSGATDGSSRRYVTWRSPQGALDHGMAALGIPLPPKAVAMVETGGPLGQQVLKAGLKATHYALGSTRFNLEVDTTTAGDPGGVVLATDGQAGAMDTLKRNMELAVFRQSHKPAQTPVITRDPDGLLLRRAGHPKTPEELIKLVALGKALRDDLAPQG